MIPLLRISLRVIDSRDRPMAILSQPLEQRYRPVLGSHIRQLSCTDRAGTSIVYSTDVPSGETLDAFCSPESRTRFAFGLVALILGIFIPLRMASRVHASTPIVWVLLTGIALVGIQCTRGL